jgi:hypothetical protein
MANWTESRRAPPDFPTLRLSAMIGPQIAGSVGKERENVTYTCHPASKARKAFIYRMLQWERPIDTLSPSSPLARLAGSD